MSGTSLRTAMANENGTVTAVSAHTPATIGVPATCSQTPRLTTSDRTKVIDPAASAAKRLRCSGGHEYAQPIASATVTAISSATPWVAAITSGVTAATATMRRPASSDRSPAAIGSHGLLTRSISTSSTWLMPTMNTFTHAPASSVHSRSAAPEARSSDAAMRYSERIDSDVPMSVCGRLKRHRTPSAPTAARGRTRPAATGGRLIDPGRYPRLCEHVARMLAAYRRTGADVPFGDPRGYHRVGMEGHFWRITQPSAGAVVVAIVAISRDAAGRAWAMDWMAAAQGGEVWSA